MYNSRCGWLFTTFERDKRLITANTFKLTIRQGGRSYRSRWPPERLGKNQSLRKHTRRERERQEKYRSPTRNPYESIASVRRQIPNASPYLSRIPRPPTSSPPSVPSILEPRATPHHHPRLHLFVPSGARRDETRAERAARGRGRGRIVKRERMRSGRGGRWWRRWRGLTQGDDGRGAGRRYIVYRQQYLLEKVSYFNL